MSNYISDLVDVFLSKLSTAVDDRYHFSGPDANAVKQALEDTRATILNGEIIPNPLGATSVAPAGKLRTAVDAGYPATSFNGRAFKPAWSGVAIARAASAGAYTPALTEHTFLELTLDANVTLNVPTVTEGAAATGGVRFDVKVTQDATGYRALTLASGFVGGARFMARQGPGQVSTLSFRRSAAGTWYLHSFDGIDLQRDLQVTDFGAVGDLSNDDTVPIQKASDTCVALGGGVVSFPRTSVAYKITARILAGPRWVQEQFLAYSYGYDLTTTTGYSLSLRNAATVAPVVSFRGAPGVEIWWGGASPATETAMLYYSIGGGLKKAASQSFIKNLTFVGELGYSAGAAAFPSGSTSITSNLIGLALAQATNVRVANVKVRECRRGIVGTDNYWSRIEQCSVDHCTTGFELLQHNAATLADPVVTYAFGYGYLMTGQGVQVRNPSTEQATWDFWIPQADQFSIDGGYLESAVNSFNGGHIRWGDSANAGLTQVVWGSISNMHGSRTVGIHQQLYGAQVHAYNVRFYSTNASSYTYFREANSSLFAVASNLPIDPAWAAAGNRNWSILNPEAAYLQGGVNFATGTRDSTNKGLGGINFGRGTLWCEASTDICFSSDNNVNPKFIIKGGSGLLKEQAGHEFRVDVKNASATLDEFSHYIVCDATAGNIVLTLPLTSAVGSGRSYVVKKIDASANTVTLAAGGSNTIEGSASVVLTTQWQAVKVFAHGGISQWMKL